VSTELSIVVVNWNAGELLRQCLESIRLHPPGVSYEIIVIDNASTDGSPERARDLADVVVVNDTNAGFARAANQGIARSRTPWLFLLNPDATVTAGAIDTLLATMRAHPRAGACGPRLLNADGSLQPSVWTNPPTPWRVLLAGLGLWRLIPRRQRGLMLFGDHWPHDELRTVPMVFGAAMLVRRETIDRAGALDERFPLYGEDDELCLRMRRAGWTILFEPHAVVVHQGSASTLQRWDAAGKLRVQQEASVLFQRISLSRPHRVANLLAQSLVSATQMLLRPSSPMPRIVLKAHLKALAQEVGRT
jgi:N-acetylglucosaminyl-diphospho-decaprenol L-rhamnosyltransferase